MKKNKLFIVASFIDLQYVKPDKDILYVTFKKSVSDALKLKKVEQKLIHINAYSSNDSRLKKLFDCLKVYVSFFWRDVIILCNHDCIYTAIAARSAKNLYWFDAYPHIGQTIEGILPLNKRIISNIFGLALEVRSEHNNIILYFDRLLKKKSKPICLKKARYKLEANQDRKIIFIGDDLFCRNKKNISNIQHGINMVAETYKLETFIKHHPQNNLSQTELNYFETYSKLPTNMPVEHYVGSDDILVSIGSSVIGCFTDNKTYSLIHLINNLTKAESSMKSLILSRENFMDHIIYLKDQDCPLIKKNMADR